MNNCFNNPLVSLITPGWNGCNFVHRLLDSILSQTYLNMEYIYVDDGSTDGTKDVVLSYKERFKARGIPFQYIWKENGGVSSAVQEGLKHMNGEFFCWPEYDDFLTPDSVEKKVRYLQAHPDCAIVTADAWLVKENDIEHPYGLLSNHNPNRYDRNHFVQALLSNSIYNAACQMCRTSVFDETHPGRRIYSSPIGPNWQILLPVYYSHNRGFIDEPLSYYLIRMNSISHGNYASYEKRAASIIEFEKAIKETLKTIEMPPEDLGLYMDMVDQKYANDRIVLGYQAMDREILMQGLDYYYNSGKSIPKDYKKFERIAQSSMRFKLFNIARNIKHYLNK